MCRAKNTAKFMIMGDIEAKERFLGKISQIETEVLEEYVCDV